MRRERAAVFAGWMLLFLCGCASAQPQGGAPLPQGAPPPAEAADGLSGEDPGNAETADGLSGEPPGNAEAADGLSGETPGNAENTDGLSGEDPANAESLEGLKPYEDWVFPECPYVLSGERYADMFSGGDAAWGVDQWFGVPRLFPFVGFGGAGIEEGRSAWREDGTFVCDEAWAIAQRFYTAAIRYSAPDGTEYVVQESNYPISRRAAELWEWWDEGESWDPLPPYDAPIRLEVAEMNYNVAGWVSFETRQDRAVYDQMTLAEKTAQQNRWMTALCRDVPEWNIPESERYYAITGLTILNGDSRTEARYAAGSRAKNIRITINGDYEKEVCLADSPAPQLIELAYRQTGIDRPVAIQIEVLDAYEGQCPDIYITEIGVGIDSNLHQGI